MTDCEDRALVRVLRVRLQQERDAGNTTLAIDLGAVERLLDLADETVQANHLIRLLKQQPKVDVDPDC